MINVGALESEEVVQICVLFGLSTVSISSRKWGFQDDRDYPGFETLLKGVQGRLPSDYLSEGSYQYSWSA